ncbi:prepilin peptidase [Prochlorococcus sp. AH-716-D22]|nr:prepilin peptidase [Prochlorococcus sp. AH-716-D22]
MLITFDYFQAFLIGCCIGSFLNVVVYRLPNDLSIVKPRSFCPKCKTKLSWRENIPLISWLIQSGKCINCGTTISLKYPLIELTTAILFVFFVNSSPSLYSSSSYLPFNIFFSWLFLSLLICISLIDIDSFWIPQGLINFGFLSGFLGLIFIGLFNDEFIDFFLVVRCLISSLISFFIFETLRYLAKYIYKKDAIGKGDSKLVAMLALWLGPLGTLFAVGISYIFAAIYCLVGLSINRVKFRQVIPFAPFLSLGGLLMWYLGNEYIFRNILRI